MAVSIEPRPTATMNTGMSSYSGWSAGTCRPSRRRSRLIPNAEARNCPKEMACGLLLLSTVENRLKPKSRMLIMTTAMAMMNTTLATNGTRS